jgi:hypothetical protein
MKLILNIHEIQTRDLASLETELITLDYATQFSDDVNEVLLFAASMRSKYSSQNLR